MHPVSIVGCGYTGSRLATRWLQQTPRVQGFATRDVSLRQIESMGGLATSLNLDQPMERSIDLDGRLVYYSVPPAPSGARDPRLERLLEHTTGAPQRVVYLSTTGVYGDCHGLHVDEETFPHPQTERAVRRLAAEDTLRTWADARHVSWTILRVPGIYGPGRMPLERLRRREPAIEPEEATPGNRIHVDDLVSVSVAAGIAPQAHRRVYNVTDGSDDSLTDFLQRVARIAELPPPPLISRSDARRTFSATSWSFLGESRRVGNARMLTELGITLQYDDLDAGIRASL
jgi:nucleoside-diphosphate-sugar epimerase